MKIKCEECNGLVTKISIRRCKGLMCPKVYCSTCFTTQCSLCPMCYQTMLCPICVLVWDICPSCLDNDNAVLNFPEELPIGV